MTYLNYFRFLAAGLRVVSVLPFGFHLILQVLCVLPSILTQGPKSASPEPVQSNIVCRSMMCMGVGFSTKSISILAFRQFVRVLPRKPERQIIARFSCFNIKIPQDIKIPQENCFPNACFLEFQLYEVKFLLSAWALLEKSERRVCNVNCAYNSSWE